MTTVDLRPNNVKTVLGRVITGIVELQAQIKYMDTAHLAEENRLSYVRCKRLQAGAYRDFSGASAAQMLFMALEELSKLNTELVSRLKGRVV